MAFLGLINTTRKTGLRDQLEQKGGTLRQRQFSQLDAVKTYNSLANEAAADSEVAAKHALAVETALGVLDDAGVEL